MTLRKIPARGIVLALLLAVFAAFCGTLYLFTRDDSSGVLVWWLLWGCIAFGVRPLVKPAERMLCHLWNGGVEEAAE